MAVLALITKSDDIPVVVPWVAAFAHTRSTDIRFVCWSYSAVTVREEDESADCDRLVDEVQSFLADWTDTQVQLVDSADVEAVVGPTSHGAVVPIANREDVELIVAAAQDQTGKTGASYATNPLLRYSPCHTIVLFGSPERSSRAERVFVGVSDTTHDGTACFLACRMAETVNCQVTLARSEMDFEQEAFEVGRRELQQIIRDAGAEGDDRIECHVFRKGDPQHTSSIMDDHDLVIMAANTPHVSAILELTTRPTVAVIKRAPQLRAWRRSKRGSDWNPRLSPADYADLIQGLRRGSRLNADFLTMLSLSAVVASIGLLQNSPAVVIGSMLLAPLMTPMIGCGLALAQANPKLGDAALRSVGLGLLATLAISYVVGVITPGAELTPQIVARGNPTVLDLVVALASAAAAAYALARPNLVGSIAGVAIATALVPPLCSGGLALAYRNVPTAQGAALLFSTNFVAIVLAAAATFRLMGVTAARAQSRQRNWVIRTTAAMGVAAIVFIIPLQRALDRSLVEAKPQPATFPLARSVVEALEAHIEQTPQLELIAAGRPSSPHDPTDVVVILGTPGTLDPQFGSELIEIVHRTMNNDSLVVEVHCIRELWQESSGRKKTTPESSEVPTDSPGVD